MGDEAKKKEEKEAAEDGVLWQYHKKKALENAQKKAAEEAEKKKAEEAKKKEEAEKKKALENAQKKAAEEAEKKKDINVKNATCEIEYLAKYFIVKGSDTKLIKTEL